MRDSESEDGGESLGLLAFPARLPLLTLVAALAATAFLGIHAARIRADASPATLLPTRPSARFGDLGVELDDAQSIVVGVFADDVLAPAALGRIAEVSNRLASMKGVAGVIGPTTLPRAERKEGEIELKPLAEEPPKTEREARDLRAEILAHPLAASVVAADARAAAISVRLEPRALESERFAALEAKVREAAAELGGPESVAIAGPPVLAAASARELEREMPGLAGACLAMVAVAALLCLRSLTGTLLTCLTVAAGVIWSVGLFELAGQRIGFASVLLPALLVLAGSAGPLILLTRLGWERSAASSRSGALAATVAHTRLPLAVWALATAIGAAALALSSVPALRAFGWQGALGAACLLGATVLLALPAAALWPAGFAPRMRAAADDETEQRLETAGSWVGRHRLAVVLLSLPLVAGAGWGAGRVVAEGTYGAYSAEESQTRRDERRISDAVAPLTTLTIAVRGYEPHAIARRESLVALGDLQQFLAKQPGVKATRSLLDYLAVLESPRERGAPFSLPESQEKIDRLLKVDPQALREVANPDLSRARITVYTTLTAPADVEQLVDAVYKFASPRLSHHGFGSRALFPRGVEIKPQGTFLAEQLAARALPAQLARIVAYAAVGLLVLASLIFLSPRVGAAAAALNLVAPLALFGLAGAAHLPLTVSSACLAPLLLGIAVGHTLHYLSSCAAAADRRSDVASAPADVVSVVGRPIAYAGAAFVLGCLTFLGSPLAPLRIAGILGSAAAAATFAANLLLLATRLLTTRILTLSDLLLVRVGRPEDIALFAGLRPFQTKIVMLTGRLATAAAGDFITRRGELKQELYVLLSGHADVRAGEGGPALGTLARGEVIGEMSLVRDQPRSADVIATEPTEYLVLDGHFLERLRRQYPRIASVVFLNLSRILSDRLERTTARLAEVGSQRGER